MLFEISLVSTEGRKEKEQQTYRRLDGSNCLVFTIEAPKNGGRDET